MPIKILDLKYALRLLLKSRWFTVLTVLVLSGGLAISIYTFAALDTLIYRELPLPDGGEIVTIQTGAWPNFEALDAFELAETKSEADTLSDVGVYRTSRSLIGDPGSALNVRTVEADWRIFEVTRTRPLLGRGFVSGDSSESGESVAVVSYGTWQSAFSGDPDIAGRLARIDGELTRVIGVMPEGFAFPVNAEMWVPLQDSLLDPPGYTGIALDSYARLRPGVAVEAAETELTALLQRIRLEHSEQDEAEPAAVSLMTFQEEPWGPLGIVVFGVLNMLSISILLLAAVNVGNLLLVRTNERIREIGVRIALGAPRLRLIMQMTLENAILCAAGGTVAVLLAQRALDVTNGFMRNLLGEDIPFWWTWRLDGEIVTAAAGLLLLTVLIVSALPAVCVSSVDPNSVLRDGARGSGGLKTGRISRWLVTIQVALISAVMIVGSAVVIIADRAAGYEFGMNIDNLLSMQVRPPPETYPTSADRLALAESLLEELRRTNGVEAALIMQTQGVASFSVDGAGASGFEEQPVATLVVLSETPTPVGPTLIQGRSFDSRDSESGLRTAIVSETLAADYWPGESPLGRRIEVAAGDSEPETRIVVGVVGDVRYDPVGMTRMGLAAIYVPLTQFVPSYPYLQLNVRHPGDETRGRNATYEALAQVDPSIPPGNLNSYAETLAQMTLFARTVTKLFAGCGAFAILLAITGIYGIASNSVVLRSAEIGLRRALGASDSNVIGIFMAQGGRQLAVGLTLSALLSTVVLAMVSQGFSISAVTLTLVGAAVLLVVSMVVLGSIYVAVRRIIGLEPSTTLRYA